MVLKRGSNTGNHSGVTGNVPAVLDLAALDDLGPSTRSVITSAPIKMLAYPVMMQIMDRNDQIEKENEAIVAAGGTHLKPYLDPKDPRLDEVIANGLLRYQLDLLAAEREIEFATAGIIPLRARPSPKSMREQRRAMRGSRRWR